MQVAGWRSKALAREEWRRSIDQARGHSARKRKKKTLKVEKEKRKEIFGNDKTVEKMIPYDIHKITKRCANT